MKLSILDQSQICEGQTASQTLDNTKKLAQEADRLGYHRYWVSEHHSSRALAHSSPEVLLAHLGANTSRIRLGSGGIMLPHYSSYKVAENFKLLEALHPGRIDVGLGRAPGGMPLSTRALQEGRVGDIDRYPEQVSDLLNYLYESIPAGHRFSGLLAAPAIQTRPELWLLGSSLGTAQIAARMGLPYAYAQFFGVPGSEDAIRYYKDYYQPTALYPEAHALAAVMVICADTEEEASRLAQSTDLFFLSLEHGRLLDFFPSVETAESYPYTDYDRERIRQIRSRRIIGSPEQVKARLLRMQDQLGIDELMVVTLTHDFQARVRSYQLVAEAFGLKAE